MSSTTVSCYLCCLSHKSTYRQQQCIIRRGLNQQHVFVNEYRSIVTCPAARTTKNIVCRLTYLCHEVDYSDETSSSLLTRLTCQQSIINYDSSLAWLSVFRSTTKW